MESPANMFILYVSDQEASCRFYSSVLNSEPLLHVPGMTEFGLGGGFILGLMPLEGAARLLGDALPDPAKGNGIPRCELYLRVPDPDLAWQKALQSGAKAISPPANRNWGHYAAYVSDPDGHVLAFACMSR